ncbi:uncharacterized protein A1O9_11992 [Exophiala aquamarina CBS 119918]|uniref:Lipocalin-like domain-containing protein n=1 Tax=Exophiala aquamarina CBS 119918 TaxID=1182545 RepID=A0A072NX50_9EURO|nr:uncharacterized protein A1O9_11992 [Exophiala aquamarina CBS 119918]KEF52002.1 hypothetical protein A1O9_11992 [Exophiala aquamarina CBS 119918]
MIEVPFEKHGKLLSGTWALISWEMFDSEEDDKTLLSKPHGDSPLGRVVISQSGYLSAILVPPMVMSQLASDDWQLASDDDVLRIGRSFTSYCGPITLFERDDGGFLWHTTVEIAHNPNWIGKPQTRRVDHSVEGGADYMTLRPNKEYTLKDGRKARGILKWQKIAP